MAQAAPLFDNRGEEHAPAVAANQFGCAYREGRCEHYYHKHRQHE